MRIRLMLLVSDLTLTAQDLPKDPPGTQKGPLIHDCPRRLEWSKSL